MLNAMEFSLVTLPNEILFRICDYVDTNTLCNSFRFVCRKLNRIANSYDRFRICARLLPALQSCYWIHPANIVGLDIRDLNKKFRSYEALLFMLQNGLFTRMRHLHLPKLHDYLINTVVSHLVKNQLIHSFSIHIDSLELSDSTRKLISIFLQQSHLNNLTIDGNLIDGEQIAWPQYCSVKLLKLGRCTLRFLLSIIEHSPHLSRLTMDHCQIDDIESKLTSNIPQQITSFTLNNIQLTMDKLEYLLSFMPLLVHLDLASTGKPFTFVQRLSKWEYFLQETLPNLLQFEFCIFCYSIDWEHFQSTMTGFNSSFWTEKKKWVVGYQFRDDWTSSFTVFTSNEHEHEKMKHNQLPWNSG